MISICIVNSIAILFNGDNSVSVLLCSTSSLSLDSSLPLDSREIVVSVFCGGDQSSSIGSFSFSNFFTVPSDWTGVSI